MQTKPFFQTALSLSLALALSACAVHSADQNLTLESTGQVMSAAETAERYDVNGNWWEIYQSPQLNALMAQALENNIDFYSKFKPRRDITDVFTAQTKKSAVCFRQTAKKVV